MTQPHGHQKYGLMSLLPYVVLFAVSMMLYGKSIGYEFIPTWDDADYVINNPYIRGFTRENVLNIFSGTFVGNYAPLHILSYALSYSIWGLDPKGYHAFNIILHGINAGLVYAVISRLTNVKMPSFLVAALFAVHPLNVENVAWVSETKTLLAAFFFFSSLLAFLRSRETGAAGIYMLSMGCFILALLAKGTVVILPLLLFAYTCYYRKEGSVQILLPFFAVGVTGVLLTLWSHTRTGSVEQDIATAGNLFGTIYPTMTTVFWKYVGLLLFPVNLSGYYDTQLYHSWVSLPVIFSVIGWLIVCVLVFWKGSRAVRFWFLWFWICLLPVSNIIPIPVYYADRYMYLPAIAFWVLLFMMLQKTVEKVFQPVRIRNTILYAVIALLSVLYGYASFNRLDVWQNELAFWQDTARTSPGLYKARLNLGVAYEKRWRFEEAEREYIAALSLYPGEKALFNLNAVRTKIRLMEQIKRE